MHTGRWTKSLGYFLLVLVPAGLVLGSGSNAVAGWWNDDYYEHTREQLKRQEHFSKDSLEVQFEREKRALKDWYRAERARLEWQLDRWDHVPGPEAAQARSAYRRQLRALEDEFEQRRDDLEDYYENLEEELEDRYEYMSDALKAQRRAHEAALRYVPHTVVVPGAVWVPSRPATRRAARATRRALRKSGSVWIYY